jgi:hypothetical protein
VCPFGDFHFPPPHRRLPKAFQLLRLFFHSRFISHRIRCVELGTIVANNNDPSYSFSLCRFAPALEWPTTGIDDRSMIALGQELRRRRQQ